MNSQFNTQKLKKALEKFKKYSKEERFLKDVKERTRRKNFFKSLIEDVLNRNMLDELVFGGMIKNLWSAMLWSNKDYLVNNIIVHNGLEKLKKEIYGLIEKNKPIGERYERFVNSVKYMGPSMVTEILCHLEPQSAGIWNDKARKALAWLEAKGVPYEKYKINSEEYERFNQFLNVLAKILENDGYKEVDFLFVDYFLWEIYNDIAQYRETEKKIEERIIRSGASRHDEIKEKIAQIGSWLGFEAETEKQVAIGSRVDDVWRARIANLGAVSYLFEVQDKGSISNLIVNLQKAQKNPTVQKLIIVSDKKQIERIKKEVGEMPESFRKAVVFWDIEQVERAHQNLEQVIEAIADLNLAED